MRPAITPQKIDDILGDEKTPAWMCGQNICNLRDLPVQDVAPNKRSISYGYSVV